MKIIGHRGAKGLAPENTIVGFRKAIELGVDMIEFDVRVSKDHYPIVHHSSVARDDGGKKLIIDKTNYKELKAHIPDLATLEEVLKFIGGRVPLYIEVKIGVDVGPVILELQQYHYKFYLASKSQKILRKLHVAFPKVPKIVIEPFSAIRAVWRSSQVGTRTLAMNQLFLWPGVIRKLSNRGFELYAYPVNDRAKAERWKRYGLAGVVTDFPDRFTN